MVDRNSSNFVIMMPWGRVGSNLVVGVLTGQPGVAVANEPTTVLRSRFANLPNGNFQTDVAQTALLRHWPNIPDTSHLLAPFRPPVNKQRFGLKLSHRSFVSPMMAYTTLRERNFRIVRMDRRNHVKSAISQFRAEQRRQISPASAFALRKGDQPPAASIIPLRPLIARIASFEAMSAEMEQYIHSFFGHEDILEIFYEDLMDDPKGQIRRIAHFIDIALPGDFDLPFEKFTSDDLKAVVRNYDEVAQGIYDAGYGRFLAG